MEIGSGFPIRADGKLFFPLGFYHISYEKYQLPYREQAVKEIAAAGFNIMHVPLGLKDGPFLDRAAALGIKIIGEPNNEELINIVKAYQDHPAMFGWNVGDDVDNGKKSPASVSQLQERVKAISPKHLTYLSGYTPEGIGNFANSADLIGMQSYPIPRKPLLQTTDALARISHKSIEEAILEVKN